jgi:hypothetical protein
MRGLLILAGLLGVAACTSAPAPLDTAFQSPEAVARAVLEGFAAGDAAGLRRLALSEEEFRRRVWPELPAARPERNLPFSYVWGDLKQKSEASLASRLARHRGHRLELVGVRFGARTAYKTFVVHRDTVFTVRDPAAAAPEEVRLCGSLIEADGRWKVFSYVVDD